MTRSGMQRWGGAMVVVRQTQTMWHCEWGIGGISWLWMMENGGSAKEGALVECTGL